MCREDCGSRVSIVDSLTRCEGVLIVEDKYLEWQTYNVFDVLFCVLFLKSFDYQKIKGIIKLQLNN
jgi:hypothetical protein